MGGFSELVKHFDKTRSYIYDFFIYGFKKRGDFKQKSNRTYDDEKRRIKSWFGDYIQEDNSKKGKSVSISLDSGSISENPLYKAYYSKSFTEKDINLHFLIIDILYNGEILSLNEIAEKINNDYNIEIENQIIRNKLSEYEKEGIIIIHKKGKTHYYSLSPDRTGEFLKNYQGLDDAVKFFSETQKFGIIGNSILKSAEIKNDIFRIKHNYIVHTLEDIIIPDILTAIEQKKYISVIKFHSKNNEITNVIPMKILSSVQTGRRYLAVYSPEIKRFTSTRLDSTEKIKIHGECPEYDGIYNEFLEAEKYCFGVSFGSYNRKAEIEKTVVNFMIDEKNESYVIDRLKREKRNGILEKIDENSFRLTINTFDSSEIIPWIRTFTGRIISVTGDNENALRRFYDDIDIMYNTYKDD